MIVFRMKNNTEHKIYKVSASDWTKSRNNIAKIISGPINDFSLQPYEVKHIGFELEIISYGSKYLEIPFSFSKYNIIREIDIYAWQPSTKESTQPLKPLSSKNDDLKLNLEELLKSANTLTENNNSNSSNEYDMIAGESVVRKPRFIVNRLGNYDVPSYIFELFKGQPISSNDLFSTLDTALPQLQKPLSYENYQEYFRLLLYLEEMQLYTDYKKYDSKGVTFKVVQFENKMGCIDEYLSLSFNASEEAYRILGIGSSVIAKLSSEDVWHGSNENVNEIQKKKHSFQGIVHKILQKSVLLKFDKTFQSNYNGEKYDIEFNFGRFNFRKLHHAIIQAGQRLSKEFLFPEKYQPCLPKIDLWINVKDGHIYDNDNNRIEFFDQQLNSQQKQAVVEILRGEGAKLPYIIDGPPGTGKTKTLIESILQIFKNFPKANILVATATNSAADNILMKLIKSGSLEKKDILRLASLTIIEKDMMDEKVLPYAATIDIGEDGVTTNIVSN